MEVALTVPASKGADVSTTADAATANTMVLMFVPLLPLPTQPERLQLVPGTKWCITSTARCAIVSLRQATGFGAPQLAVGSGWTEAAGAPLLALEQEGPHARGRFEWNEQCISGGRLKS